MGANEPMQPPPAPENQNKQKRVSLSKTDQNAEVGIDLLEICQAITADGSVSPEEINELQQWLEMNEQANMPAIRYLRETVRRIVADGVVTDEERQDLYKAIERVLPIELRRYAVARRKDAEVIAKRRLKEQNEAAKRELADKKERDRPVHYFDFMTAGVAYENRAQFIRKFAKTNTPAYLIREPGNKYSPHAVAVHIPSGGMIGYVPEVEAPDLAGFLDNGFPYRAYVKTVLRQTRSGYPIPILAGEFYRPDADMLTLTEQFSPGYAARAAAAKLGIGVVERDPSEIILSSANRSYEVRETYRLHLKQNCGTRVAVQSSR